VAGDPLLDPAAPPMPPGTPPVPIWGSEVMVQLQQQMPETAPTNVATTKTRFQMFPVFIKEKLSCAEKPAPRPRGGGDQGRAVSRPTKWLAVQWAKEARSVDKPTDKNKLSKENLRTSASPGIPAETNTDLKHTKEGTSPALGADPRPKCVGGAHSIRH
jgi:hypothetical protein